MAGQAVQHALQYDSSGKPVLMGPDQMVGAYGAGINAMGTQGPPVGARDYIDAIAHALTGGALPSGGGQVGMVRFPLKAPRGADDILTSADAAKRQLRGQLETIAAYGGELGGSAMKPNKAPVSFGPKPYSADWSEGMVSQDMFPVLARLRGLTKGQKSRLKDPKSLQAEGREAAGLSDMFLRPHIR